MAYAIILLVKLQSLACAKKTGMPFDGTTATWLSGIDDELHDRLARLSLVAARSYVGNAVTIHDFVEQYISSRGKLEVRTLTNYRATQRILEHFGADHLISAINAGHARDYREWMIKRYANATVSREIKRAK